MEKMHLEEMELRLLDQPPLKLRDRLSGLFFAQILENGVL